MKSNKLLLQSETSAALKDRDADNCYISSFFLCVAAVYLHGITQINSCLSFTKVQVSNLWVKLINHQEESSVGSTVIWVQLTVFCLFCRFSRSNKDMWLWVFFVFFFEIITHIRVRDEPQWRILQLITIIKRCHNLKSERYTVVVKIIARLKRF